MKIALTFFFAALLSKGCNQANQNIDKATIVYHVTTRGFFRHVTLSKEGVKVYKDRNLKDSPEVVQINSNERELLANAFKKLNLDEIASYKAPSEKRFYDGAAIATLIITYNGTTYESQPFDHKNPPTQLKQLVQFLEGYTIENE
jgi:hypothetical protein